MRLLEFRSDRLPGIPTPFGFAAGPGLNLVVGPNGIGKSSFARALHFLLWPRRGQPSTDLAVHADFQVGTHVLRAGYRGVGDVSWTREGRAVPAPDLPPESLAACHHLDVLDLMPILLHEDDVRLAEDLMKELGGGVNLVRLRDQLFGGRGTATRGKQDEFRQADARIARIVAAHRGLLDEESALGELTADREAALRARTRLTLLEQVQKRLERAAEAELARRELQTIPAGVEFVRPGDPEDLDRFRTDVAARLQEREGLRQELAQVEADLAACRLTEDPLPVLEPIRNDARTLRELGGKFDQAASQRNQTLARLEEAGRDLPGGAIPPGRWEAIDAEAIRALVQHTGDLIQHRRSLAALDPTAVDDGNPGTGADRIFMACGMGALVLGAAALLGFGLREAGLAGIVLGLSLLGGGLALRAQGRASRRRNRELFDAARHAAEIAEQEARRRYTTACERLGLAAEDADPALPLVLQAALEARRARADADRSLAECEGLESRRVDLLAEINARLAPLGAAACQTVAEVESTLTALTREWERRQALVEKRGEWSARLADCAAGLARREQEIDALLSRLRLQDDPDPAREVHRFASQLPRRKQLASTLLNLETVIADLDGEIERGRDLFPGEDPTALDPAALSARIERERELADGFAGISERIGSIRKSLELARRGHELQEALAARERAKDDLLDILDVQLLNQCGRLMLDRARGDHRQKTRPVALEQADRYLRSFTGLAYGLALLETGNEDPAFTAVRLDTGTHLSPAQLSAGTRVQLILAVRLGFLGSLGSHARPPLVLDDTLGSSDPVRFRAIAVALGRLCAGGDRQVFYLCPRPGEAEAWSGIMQAEGLDAPRLIDLAAIRGRAESAGPHILRAMDAPGRTPPEPRGLTASEYGERLRVPRVDLRGDPGALPLFYILTDHLDRLHVLLLAGCATVGRWESAREGLLAAGILDDDRATALEARIKVWRRFHGAWAVGRPPRVPLALLEESSAVSDRFLDRVADLLAKVDGDGAALLAGLRGGEVPRFQKANVDQLQDELESAGYLDSRRPLERDALLGAVLEGAGEEIRSGLLDMETVHRLVDRFLAQE
ncbi:MAG: ATP-binding protein [Candidatus Krumholzibacteriia bacterium]